MARLPLAPDTSRQFGSFVVAGAIGFVVDVAVLYGALAIGIGPLLGRVFSFLAAVTCTWLFNRRYTFAATASPWREWWRYLSVMLAGMVVNFACYSLVLFLMPGEWWWRPALAVMAGSAAGLLVNFVNAKLFVYKS